jgi:hypothetical protein
MVCLAKVFGYSIERKPTPSHPLLSFKFFKTLIRFTVSGLSNKVSFFLQLEFWEAYRQFFRIDKLPLLNKSVPSVKRPIFIELLFKAKILIFGHLVWPKSGINIMSAIVIIDAIFYVIPLTLGVPMNLLTSHLKGNRQRKSQGWFCFPIPSKTPGCCMHNFESIKFQRLTVFLLISLKKLSPKFVWTSKNKAAYRFYFNNHHFGNDSFAFRQRQE